MDKTTPSAIIDQDSDKTFVLEALRPSYLSPFMKENDQRNLLKPIQATFIESLLKSFITFFNSTERMLSSSTFKLMKKSL
ncbi:hypothetical protein M0802_001712 [Mischocyttarus mexicanus]|nr:hypothetical protein M0802_001712 [Mischocyttarus mexicanus]